MRRQLILAGGLQLLLLLLLRVAAGAAASAQPSPQPEPSPQPQPQPQPQPEDPLPALPAARPTASPAAVTTPFPLEVAAQEAAEEGAGAKEEPEESSRQPDTTTLPTSTSTATSAVSSPPEPDTTARPPLYRLTDSDDDTCILMEMDAVLTIRYETMSKEIREVEKYVPEASPSGSCSDNEASLTIEWRNLKLSWRFTKMPGGERWYINEVKLQYHKPDSMFENASSTGDVTLTTRRAHGTVLFPTPVGKSCHYQSEYALQLSGSGTDSATLLLREFRVQSFMFHADFGSAFACQPSGAPKFRDETAPIAVGSTLAVVVLLTVTGYGVYRYFKIKKVQYDTME